MAIGDISSTSKVVKIARFKGTVDPDRPESLYQDPIFVRAPFRCGNENYVTKPVQSKLSLLYGLSKKIISFLIKLPLILPKLPLTIFVWGRRWFIYLRYRSNRSGPIPYKEFIGRKILTDFIRLTSDKRVLGTRSSINIWEVPFQHFVLLSQEGGPCDTIMVQSNIETEVSDAIKRELHGYLDPDKPVCVRCMPCPALKANSEREVHVFMGQSVFAPERDSVQIGWVRFVPEGKSENQALLPKFPDGDSSAIYTGQESVGFAIADPTLPSNLSLPLNLENPSGVWLSIHGMTSFGSNQVNGSEHVLFERRTTQGTGEVRVMGDLKMQQSENELIDACLPLIITVQNKKSGQGQQKISGMLEVCLDSRASRLHYNSSSASDYALHAIEVKQGDLPDGAKGVWINLDAHKNLIFSSMQTPRYTACYRFDEQSVSYVDWHKPRLTPTPFGSGLIAEATDDRIRFFRANDEPFGFLTPSDLAKTITFMSETNSEDRYALDWLNASGRIIMEGEVIGLAEAYSNAKDLPNQLCQNAQSGDETIRLGPLVLERV